jgi:hypothetical protein
MNKTWTNFAPGTLRKKAELDGLRAGFGAGIGNLEHTPPLTNTSVPRAKRLPAMPASGNNRPLSGCARLSYQTVGWIEQR